MKTKTDNVSKEVLEADFFALLKAAAQAQGYTIYMDPAKAHHWRTPFINRIFVEPSRAMLIALWGVIAIAAWSWILAGVFRFEWATPLAIALPLFGGMNIAFAYAFAPYPYRLEQAVKDEWEHLHPGIPTP